jgi:hypothetical protein
MKLLFKRDQSGRSWVGSPNFKLWAKVDLDEEERLLMIRYSMTHAIIIDIPQPGLFARSVLLGLFIFVVALPIIA